MKRLLAVAFAAFTLLGCRSNGQATDPFFGRTTIEPPPTGSVLGQSEPYYQPSNPAGAQAPSPLRPITGPQPTLAAPTPGTNQGSYPPPPTRYAVPAAAPTPPGNPSGSYPYQNNNNRGVPADPTGWHGATTSCPPPCVPVACVPAYCCPPAWRCPPGTVPVAAQPACNAALDARLASRPTAGCGGSLPPCYNAAVGGSPYGNPSAAPSARSSGQPIDITDLPEHHDGGLSLPPPPSGAAADARPGSPTASQVVQTAANVPAGDGDPAAAGPRQTNYANDAAYQSLRGRLEYSTVEKVWKLRIAPANGGKSGQTGSIVIANPTVLVGYERGDWVEARGRLSTPNPAGQDSVPRYEVVDIQRVGT